MTTDTQPRAPKDDEIDALWALLSSAAIASPTKFARDVLAKWGTPPAVAGEPVVWRSWDSENSRWNLTLWPDEWVGHADVWEPLYATPQPTPAQSGAVPLTDEQIRAMCKEPWIFDTAKQWVRLIEAHHGIKGGQHG